jgi:hypothetical protein
MARGQGVAFDPGAGTLESVGLGRLAASHEPTIRFIDK